MKNMQLKKQKVKMTELKLTFKLNIFCQPILGQDMNYEL